jgi:type IV secretory pathway VirB10-like protein
MASHAHGDHHHDPFHDYVDGEDIAPHGAIPAEPKTPLWMPIVGVILFAILLVYGLSAPTAEEENTAGKSIAASINSVVPGFLPAPSAAPPTEKAPEPAAAPPPPPPSPRPNAQPRPMPIQPRLPPVPPSPPAGH